MKVCNISFFNFPAPHIAFALVRGHKTLSTISYQPKTKKKLFENLVHINCKQINKRDGNIYLQFELNFTYLREFMNEKLKRFFYLLGIQFFFIAIHAILNKSEVGNSFLFGYSFQRLILICGVSIPTIYFIAGIIKSYTNKPAFENTFAQFKKLIFSPPIKYIAMLSIYTLLVTIFSLLCFYIFFQTEIETFFDELPYIYNLIQPYIFFYFLICFQLILFVSMRDRNNENLLVTKIRLKFPYFLVLLVFFLSTLFNYNFFMQPKYSVATNDTGAYIEASKIDFYKRDFYASNRPATISGFYKIFAPESGYELNNVAQTYENSKNIIEFQQDFVNIALWQSILSSASWLTLALTITKILEKQFLKILGGVTIILFSIVPQITDWNNVLQSESLSISLFALTLAIGLIWSKRLLNFPISSNTKNILLTILFVLCLSIWIFSRDSNAYFLLVLIFFIILSITIPKLKESVPVMLLIGTLFSLLLIYLFYNSTFKESDRWVNPVMNNIKVYILPDEDNTELFKSFGMPIDEEVLNLPRGLSEGSYKENEALMGWLSSNGLNAYTRFLINSPNHTISLPINSIDDVFSENIQPYFINRKTPNLVSEIGNILHLKNEKFLVLESIVLILFLLKILNNPINLYVSSFWIFVLFFTSSLLMYIATVHGDASSIGIPPKKWRRKMSENPVN
jgi:hypothetical protein